MSPPFHIVMMSDGLIRRNDQPSCLALERRAYRAILPATVRIIYNVLAATRQANRVKGYPP